LFGRALGTFSFLVFNKGASTLSDGFLRFFGLFAVFGFLTPYVIISLNKRCIQLTQYGL
jgi:hypothetical protein